METFSMTCSCGDTMTVDAATRQEAAQKLKAIMTPDAVARHMAERHAGQPVLPLSQVHAMIEQNVRAV